MSDLDPEISLFPTYPDHSAVRRRLKSPWIAGAIAALLLTGIMVSTGLCDKTATTAGTASTGLFASAEITAVSTAQQSSIGTSQKAARIVNVNTSDAFTATLAKLETLPIKGRAPKTGYSREAFGPAWTDDVNVEGGHNGCDTRNDVLRRDLIDITVKPGSNGCTVLSGTLIDPYTGTTTPFTRGSKTSVAVQIDHVVALSDAWQKGAQQLEPKTRQDFANDPRNLQATGGATNEQKGDGDAATWLPPNKAYRCTYVSRQVEVKVLYGLWVTQAEHDAIANLLIGCGGTAPPPTVPTATDDAPASVAPAAAPASVEPSPPLAPSTTPSSAPGRGVVHPGAFCSTPGATGISSKGKPMVCSEDNAGRYRWTAE